MQSLSRTNDGYSFPHVFDIYGKWGKHGHSSTLARRCGSPAVDQLLGRSSADLARTTRNSTRFTIKICGLNFGNQTFRQRGWRLICLGLLFCTSGGESKSEQTDLQSQKCGSLGCTILIDTCCTLHSMSITHTQLETICF